MWVWLSYCFGLHVWGRWMYSHRSYSSSCVSLSGVLDSWCIQSWHQHQCRRTSWWLISHFTLVLIQLIIISLYAFLDNPPTWKENVGPQQCWDSYLLMSACYNSGSKSETALRLLPSSDGSGITSHYNCLLRLHCDVFALANPLGRKLGQSWAHGGVSY